MRLKELNPMLVEYAEYVAKRLNIHFKTALRQIQNGERIRHYPAKAPPHPKKTGFDPNKPAILYYLRIDHLSQSPLYKIGITNKTIKDRHRANFDTITVLRQRCYQNGADAYRKEQEIIQNNIPFLYRGPALLKSGNSELFEKNIVDSFPAITGPTTPLDH